MGVIFFLGFLIILFFIALFFIVVSIVAIILWNVRKQKGKAPRKLWLVLPSVLLTISLLAAILPFGYIGFIRSTNSQLVDNVVYAKSGTVIYWPIDDFYNNTTTAWFEMDGIKFVRQDYSVDSENYSLGEPIANIQSNPSLSNWFGEFMTFLGTGKTAKQLNVSAIYPIENDEGLVLYAVKGNSGVGIYCPSE